MPDDNTNPIIPQPADPTAPISDTSSPTDIPAPTTPQPSVPIDQPLEPTPPAPAVPTASMDPTLPVDDNNNGSNESSDQAVTVVSEVPSDVAQKIEESHNVLIALSSDPSVDEMASAIGLSLFLDKMGKRATAIYSGSTPNALEFLKPEETFESTADTLQDFVIALNKEKADHLRYKLDGDYVKIYITPYRTRIAEDDLEFSYGDFNVDLVLALDVTNGIDLDSALREHGRIMHDAVIINITTGNPGKFGEIEWSDKNASSVSEMIAKLLYSLRGDTKIEKEEATAFLTGIVAATNRFSNAKTTPDTMKISSRLMESGANQQLISKNITPETDNEMYSLSKRTSDDKDDGSRARSNDPTNLSIKHNTKDEVNEEKEVSDVITEKESTLLDDLKAAEEDLAHTGEETTPDLSDKPINIEDVDKDSKTAPGIEMSTETPASPSVEPTSSATVKPLSDPLANSSEEASKVPSAEPSIEESKEPSKELSTEPTLPTVDSAFLESTKEESKSDEESSEHQDSEEPITEPAPEKVITPPSDFSADTSSVESDKYSKMLEEALNDVNAPAPKMDAESIGSPVDTANDASVNPALASAPAVPTNPEINGVPSINYMPMPGEEVLPPPPAPPINIDGVLPSTPEAAPAPATTPSTPIEPATPATNPEPTSLGSQPAMQDQVYTPQASDPSAFKIPGM